MATTSTTLSLFKIAAAQVLNVGAPTWLGPSGTVFFDGTTALLRLGDGKTPGGIIVAAALAGDGLTFNTTTYKLDVTPGYISNTGTTNTLNITSNSFTLGGNTISINTSGVLIVNGQPITGGTDGTGNGYTGSVGFVGSRGVIGSTGFVGSQGFVGYTGSAGTGGGTNNLVFTSTGTQRKLTGYIDPNGTTYTVRTSEITAGTLILNLAGFTPTLSATVIPSTSLNWDVPATGFSVSVTNPLDYVTDFISSVASITAQSGNVTSTVGNYTTTGPSATPAGGVSWNQTFNTNGSAFIRSTSNTIAGGTASALVNFNKKTTGNLTETLYADNTGSWTVTWNTPTVSIAMVDVSGNTFLQTYPATTYAVTVTGITTPGNYTLAITGSGGTLSNATSNGTITFTAPIHKDNTAATRSVAVTATLTRPVSVTGSSYAVQVSANDTAVSASFTFPTFSIFTASVSQPPVRTDIITGSAFTVSTTLLGNQAKTFAGTVNNSQAVPRVFWFGVRASASQPTSFKTGASASLLSDVAITNSTVQLSPDTVPSGYLLELYNLYGIILQPGNTYVSIS